MEAVKQGSAAVGLVSKTHAVIAALKRYVGLRVCARHLQAHAGLSIDTARLASNQAA